jgi:hypothetical protein
MKTQQEIREEIIRLTKIRDERFAKGENYMSARDMIFALHWVLYGDPR